MKYKIPAVVVGLNLNGLATVRALGRNGIPVIGINEGQGLPGEYSKYCKSYKVANLSQNPELLLDALFSIYEDYKTPLPVFVGSDLYLDVLSRNREELSQNFLFPISSRESVERIGDKKAFYKFCQSNDLPIPKTQFATSSSELLEASEDINYPVIVKPTIATVLWRTKGWKVFFAKDKEELLSIGRASLEVHPDLIIQEVTPGPDSALQVSIFYFDQNYKEVVAFSGRKVRQYIPKYGIASLAESTNCPEVIEESRKIFSALRYSGFGSVEFKRHSGNGKLFITEVTGRFFYPHAISIHSGINIPLIAYCDLLGKELPAIPMEYPAGVKWFDEVADLKSSFYYLRKGESSLSDIIKSYRGNLNFGTLSRDDWKPGARLLLLSVKSTVRYVASLIIKPKKLARLFYRPQTKIRL